MCEAYGVTIHPHRKALPQLYGYQGKALPMQVSKKETWHVHVKISAEIKRGFVTLGDHRGDLDNYINHETKEKALKKIFYSDDFYSYDKDQRIMLNLPEPSPEKRPRRKVIKEEAVVHQKKSD